MARSTLLALLAAVLTIAASQAPAAAGDRFDRFKEEVHVGFWRNTCWPKPFVYPDRKAAFAPMHIMADNGWRRYNLIGAHHFTPDGTQLNRAGELKVRWVLTQAPPHRQNLFVENGFTAAETGHRIQAVQQFASHIAPEGGFSVADTHIVAEGRSAIDVDWSMVQFRQNAPVPVLPERQGITALDD